MASRPSPDVPIIAACHRVTSRRRRPRAGFSSMCSTSRGAKREPSVANHPRQNCPFLTQQDCRPPKPGITGSGRGRSAPEGRRARSRPGLFVLRSELSAMACRLTPARPPRPVQSTVTLVAPAVTSARARRAGGCYRGAGVHGAGRVDFQVVSGVHTPQPLQAAVHSDEVATTSSAARPAGCGVSICTRRPSRMIAMRSPILIAVVDVVAAEDDRLSPLAVHLRKYRPACVHG